MRIPLLGFGLAQSDARRFPASLKLALAGHLPVTNRLRWVVFGVVLAQVAVDAWCPGSAN
jgi:hypothetical protein